MKWAISNDKLKNPNDMDPKNQNPNHFKNLPLTKDKNNGKELDDVLKGELENLPDKFGVWVTHHLQNPEDFKDPKVRRKYEIFCGGFLCFYDRDFLEYLIELSGKSVKTGVTDTVVKTLKDYFEKQGRLSKNLVDSGKLRLEHKIFFEWGKGGDAAKKGEKDSNGNKIEPDQYYVRIYISPPAGNPDPPTTPGPPPPEPSN